MDLDLTDKLHRDALVWACEFAHRSTPEGKRDRCAGIEWEQSATDKSRGDALRALLSPESCAAIVRLLFAEHKIGLTVSSDRYHEGWWLDLVNPYALPHPEQVGEVMSEDIPAFVFGLLSYDQNKDPLAKFRSRA